MIEVSFRFKVSDGMVSNDKLVNIVLSEESDSIMTYGVSNKIDVLNQVLNININDKTIKEWISDNR